MHRHDPSLGKRPWTGRGVRRTFVWTLFLMGQHSVVSSENASATVHFETRTALWQMR